ncbi:MAG: hypothetical protein RJA21_1041 [Gemmatimonadota bacterium]|jgi:hypothetical protein
MAERKSFLIRVDREVLDAVQRWANDDLRSLNGQIEFLLRRALRDTGRVSPPVPLDHTTPLHDVDHNVDHDVDHEST